MKIAAQTIGSSLFSLKPTNGLTSDEINTMKCDITTINRDRKLDSILEDKEFKEFKEEELYHRWNHG